MHVLIFGLYPLNSSDVYSGVMRAVTNLSNSLANCDGTDVTFVTPHRFRGLIKRQKILNVKNLKILRISYLSVIPFVRSQRNARIISIHGISFFNFLAATKYLHRSHAKIVYTAHGLIKLEKKFGYRYSKLKEFIEKMILKRSDFVTTVSEDTRQHILDLYGIPSEKVKVIGNGVNLADFRPNQSRHAPKDRITAQILFVGSITPIKGLDFLLNSILKLGHLSLTLKLIGEKTDYLSWLERKYSGLFKKNIVVYCGMAGQGDLIQYYSNSDFCILPSQYDQFGQVVLEAFAMRKPVIVSNRVGARVIVDEGKDGFIIKYGDTGTMAKCIEKLIVNQKLRVKMGEHACRKAEKFSWHCIAEQYQEFFSNILR